MTWHRSIQISLTAPSIAASPRVPSTAVGAPAGFSSRTGAGRKAVHRDKHRRASTTHRSGPRTGTASAGYSRNSACDDYRPSGGIENSACEALTCAQAERLANREEAARPADQRRWWRLDLEQRSVLEPGGVVAPDGRAGYRGKTGKHPARSTAARVRITRILP